MLCGTLLDKIHYGGTDISIWMKIPKWSKRILVWNPQERKKEDSNNDLEAWCENSYGKKKYSLLLPHKTRLMAIEMG